MICSFICEKTIDPSSIESTLACGHFICEKCLKLYDNLAIKNSFQSLKCPSPDCEKEVFQYCAGNCGELCLIKIITEKIKVYCEKCLPISRKSKQKNIMEKNSLITQFLSKAKEISIKRKKENSEKNTTFEDKNIYNLTATYQDGNRIFRDTFNDSKRQAIEFKQDRYSKLDKSFEKNDVSSLKILMPEGLCAEKLKNPSGNQINEEILNAVKNFPVQVTNRKTSNSNEITNKTKKELLEKNRISEDEEILNTFLSHECGNKLSNETITDTIIKRIESKEKKKLKCDKCDQDLGYRFLKKLIPKELYSEYLIFQYENEKTDNVSLNSKLKSKSIIKDSTKIHLERDNLHSTNSTMAKEPINNDGKFKLNPDINEEEKEIDHDKNKFIPNKRPQSHEPLRNGKKMNEIYDQKNSDDYLTCYICFKKQNCKYLLFLECSHEFCSNCLKKDWQTKIESKQINEYVCPLCKKKISYNFLKANLDSELFSEYDELLAKAYIQENTKKVYCPQENCLHMNLADKKLSYILCSKCKFKFCITCYQGWEKHMGYTCNEFKLKLDTQDLKRKYNFKKTEEIKVPSNEKYTKVLPKNNKIEKNTYFLYNKSTSSNLKRPKIEKVRESVNYDEKKDNNSIFNTNRKLLWSRPVRTQYNFQKKETFEKCKSCNSMLSSHLLHDCGEILCNKTFIEFVKRIIKLNLKTNVKCKKCFKDVEIDLLRKIIPENLLIEYREKMSDAQNKNEYTNKAQFK